MIPQTSRRATWPALVLFCGVLTPRAGVAAFTDVTDLYGIASGDSMSYAASFHDYDGDGDQDFYVNNHWKNGADFYRNDGGVPWVNVDSFLGTGNADRHDALWGDFNNDGSPDLYLVRGHEQYNELFWNGGGGVMEEGAAAAGVGDFNGRAREITLSDLNNDGWLDIFLVNDFRAGFTRPSVLFLNNGNGTFFRYPNTGAMFFSRLHVSSIDYDLDGDVDLMMTNPPFAPGELWRNDGGFVFKETRAAAFAGITTPLLQANGLSWADYDNDGDSDLLTCSGNRAVWDYVALEGDSLRWYAECHPNEERRLEFVTEGDSVSLFGATATYDPITVHLGSGAGSTSVYPASFAVSDLVGEPAGFLAGNSGLYLWSSAAALGDSVHLVLKQGLSETADLIVGGSVRANGPGIAAWQTVGYLPRPGFAMANFTNRLYRNEGNGTFAEVTQAAFAVNDSAASSLGATWGDYDGDGWIDVYVTNSGNVEVGNVANYLYRNNGDGTFAEVAAAEGVQGSVRGLGDGAAWVDADGDGFLDLYVDNGAEHPPFGVGPRELFANPGNANHWLELDLRAFTGNGSGIGARIRLVAASGVQWRTVLGESDNCFSGPLTVHFGLGASGIADSLQVFWPSGPVDTYRTVVADRRYWILEGKPLRLNQNPHFIVPVGSVADTVTEGEGTSWSVAVDNYGGRASAYGVRYESCGGTPITWLTVDPDTGGVWPGGGSPLDVLADASGLSPGSYCGRAIFVGNSFLGADTLIVNLTVQPNVVGVDPFQGGLPSSLTLGPVRPNPGRGEFQASLGIPRAGRVHAAIYSVTGRRIATLTDEWHAAGWHTLSWSGRESGGHPAASGVYLLRVEAEGERFTRKLVRLE